MNTYIPALTSLRFFAALLVFLSHTGAFHEGHIGVSFFFVLSGFVMSHTYGNAIQSKNIQFKEFILLRISRIAPLHWLTLLIFIVLCIFGAISQDDIFNTWALTANLLLIHAFFLDTYDTYNIVSWSISAEMFFYAIFFFLVVLNTKNLLLIFFTILSLVIAIIPSDSSLNILKLDFVAKNVNFFTYIFPPPRLVDFIAGMLIFRFQNYMRPTHYIFASVFQIASIMLLLVFLDYHYSVIWAYRYDVYYLIPMSLIVWAFSLRGLLSSLLTNRVLIFLGESSFAFYMIHSLIVRCGAISADHLTALTGIEPGLAYKLMFSLILFTATIIASSFLYLAFEMPAKHYLRNRLLSQQRAGGSQRALS